jgi:hypothetical protein
MLHAAHEGRAPALVACTPPFAASRPTNEFFVFTVEKGPPEEILTILGLIGSVPADYTLLSMNQS